MNPCLVILDSGAVSFYNKCVKKHSRGAPGRAFKYRTNECHDYTQTQAFLDYRESYVQYILKNEKYLTGYINLDIINNAEASYEQLKYLESKGCKPMPVYHLGNDSKWLQRYVDEGYKAICIGGIVPNRYASVRPILDELWSNILTDKDGYPLVKVHGLAVTSFYLLKRYPWWSGDSASWRKAGGYGKIFIPRKKNGKWDFNRCAVALRCTRTPSLRNYRSFDSINEEGKKWALEWLDYIKVPFGIVGKDDEMIEWGVVSSHSARSVANLHYHYHLVSSLPKWPWPFKIKRRMKIL